MPFPIQRIQIRIEQAIPKRRAVINTIWSPDSMREHIKLLEQTAKLFAEALKHPAATKTAAELSRWRQALAKLIVATYPAKRYRPTIANL